MKLFLYAFSNGNLVFITEDRDEKYLLDMFSDDNYIYADSEAYTMEELEEIGTLTKLNNKISNVQ